MGLDTVELVIRFEDAFGIAIPNEIAAQLITPRKVTDYVLAQLPTSDESSCLSQRAFYFLRGKLVLSLNVARKDLRPGTRLENVMPLATRRLVWASLKSQVAPAALPDLVRPAWLISLLSLIALLALINATIYASNNLVVGPNFAFLFGLLVTLVAGYSGAVATRPFKRHFRREYECAGDLAKYLMMSSPHSFKREKEGWTREQVAIVVREIIIDQVGTKDFTEDSRFVQDMHLD